jgi:hypothetical protein
MALWDALFDDAHRFERMRAFQVRIETQLKKLLRLRTEGRPEVWKAVKDFKPAYEMEDAQRLPNFASAVAQWLKQRSASEADEEGERAGVGNRE